MRKYKSLTNRRIGLTIWEIKAHYDQNKILYYLQDHVYSTIWENIFLIKKLSTLMWYRSEDRIELILKWDYKITIWETLKLLKFLKTIKK